MKKSEMVRLLCRDYGYSPAFFEGKTHAEVRKILSHEKGEQKNLSVDDADLFPNGPQEDTSDEDYV